VSRERDHAEVKRQATNSNSKRKNSKNKMAHSSSGHGQAAVTRQTSFFVESDDFKELFLMFDKDNGGSIDEQEFNQMLRVLGINVKFPKESDEGITFPELCALLNHLSRPLSRDEEIKEAYKFFAPAGGQITPSSLIAAYKLLGDHTLSARDAANLLGVRQEVEMMTDEEWENAKDHGAGLGETATGMGYNEFEFRLLSTMTKEDEEGLLNRQSASPGAGRGKARSPGRKGSTFGS